MIVQHKPEHESLPTRRSQSPKPAKVRAAHGRRRLHLDAHNPPLAVLDDDIDLVALLVAEMRELKPALGPAGQLQQLCDDKSFQQRTERRPVSTDPLWREPPQGCQQAGIKEMQLGCACEPLSPCRLE